MSLVKVPYNYSNTVLVTAFHTRQLFGQCVYGCGDVSI